MANPRVFISSTCYDLQEVRYQLRKFIEDIGYEPVMSDFGDIFYDYKKHIQDSCKLEIEKCQLFVLIIGNHYGSFYHKHKDKVTPDSVTLQELKKALEVDVYKHVFINKYVEYDYKNYVSSLKKHITQKIKSEEASEELVSKIRNEYSQSYPFPQESYKYIFNFLDVVYSLETNNAVISYDTFDDIKNTLRKQWAGFMYDSIVSNRQISHSAIEEINKNIAKIDSQLRSLIESQIPSEKEGKHVSFDITKLITEVSSDDFVRLRDRIHELTTYFLIDEGFDSYDNRVVFHEEITQQSFIRWIEGLEDVGIKFKWAKTIGVDILFTGLLSSYSWFSDHMEIATKKVMEYAMLLKELKNRLEDNEFKSLIDVLVIEYNKYYSDDENQNAGDDLPF